MGEFEVVLNSDDLNIMNKLVGILDENTAAVMKDNIDYFLHPKVSLFIPSSGQCKYAVTPSHTHPAYSFLYYFQPGSELIVEGKSISYDFTDGKCLSVISPDIPHQEPEQEGFESYIAIMIDAELFRETIVQYTSQPLPVFRGERFTPHPELLSLLRCFMLEAGEYENKNKEYLDQLALAVIHLAVRSVISNTSKALSMYNRFEVDKVIAYMNCQFEKKITIDDLADHVNLSASQLTKIFKSVTGTTPIDFLNIMRLKKARNMLSNNTYNITEIALKCGFNSLSYFSSCFIDKYKITPTEYRQMFQQKQ